MTHKIYINEQDKEDIKNTIKNYLSLKNSIDASNVNVADIDKRIATLLSLKEVGHLEKVIIYLQHENTKIANSVIKKKNIDNMVELEERMNINDEIIEKISFEISLRGIPTVTRRKRKLFI